MVKRRFTDALKIIEPYIQKNPRNAEAFSLKGDCHYQLLEFNKAVECYKIARKLDPAYYPALRGLGFVELNIAKKAFKENDTLKAYNHFEHAITILREANKILPRDMNVVYGRAYAAEGMGRFFYQRSLNLFRMRKDLQGAETMADKAQQFFNESIEMARMYSMHFDRKIEPRALIGDIFVRIALLHQEFGRNAQANQAMRNALITWQSVLHDIDPENVRAKENVAKCSEWLQKYSPKGVNSGKGAEISIGK
jgi:tetratricopeptide (TPR) repeat protein